VSQRYEVLFILRPDLGEAGVNDQLQRARQVLAQHGAAEVGMQDWGVRDLAYAIENQHKGRYVLLHYDGEPIAVTELERSFRLSDQVLRYMSVRQVNGEQFDVGAMGPPGAERDSRDSDDEGDSDRESDDGDERDADEGER
jgi:small subunit ribosomal protein S6